MKLFRFTVALTVILSLWSLTMAQSGFDTSRMNTSADACEDFFEYANGTWIKNTEIPADKTRWGSFNTLAENNDSILKGILEKAVSTKAAKGSDMQLVGDFYASCMDEAAIEKAGASALKPIFKQIDKLKNTDDLQRQIAEMHKAGLPALFGFGASPDAKNSSMVIANAGQGGLSLPNRDYYFKDDAKSVETRAKFMEYMTNMFKLIGDNEMTAAENARTVMELQTKLAKASKSPVELRDPEARYNKKTLAQLAEMTPNFSWTNYMKTRGVPPVTEVNIGQPDFFKELNVLINNYGLDNWKVYLRFMVINASAGRLSKAFVDENWNFYSKYLGGAKEQQKRWKTCVSATDGAVGESLGTEYVKAAFKPEAKKKMDDLISNLFAAFKVRINQLEWMSDETKAKAQGKLATFKRKIGYPDTLRGYKGLEISRKSFLTNVQNVGKFAIARNLEDINKAPDKTRWGMTPPTVNAYYNPLFNEIAFPAGILQPPFFNPAADDAINYGAIGGVIGHEISHGFDDSGSQYDAEGNLKSWWTKEDRTKFEERASCVVDQFNKYEVQPSLFINGKLTLGENIGDLGGLNVALEAYMKSLEGKERPANIDGFTPEQRFFLGWAQVWANKSRPEAERQQVLTDPHSAARWRVNGPMSNMAQFSKAFGCKTGDAMMREKMCIIW
jgi:putative endopeptidase